MGVGVGNQGVEAVPGRLGLGLDLQGVISGFAEVAEFQNGVEVWRSVGRYERSAAGGAADGVGSASNACPRAIGVHSVASNQDVVTTRTSVARGEHDVAGQLPLDVGVVLHHLSLPEVSGLVKIGAAKCVHRRRSVKNGKSTGVVGDRAARTASRCSTERSRLGAPTELEDIALGEKGRVLPKALRALAPRGIVIDRESGPHHGLVAAENLPGRANARLKGLPIHVYASRPTNATLIGDKKLARGGIRTRGNTGRNKVRQATGSLGNWCGQVPRQTDVES